MASMFGICSVAIKLKKGTFLLGSENKIWKKINNKIMAACVNGNVRVITNFWWYLLKNYGIQIK